MKIYEYRLGVSPDNRERAIALGFFDGVHSAHRRLLSVTRDAARSRDLEFSVFTFRSECGIKDGDRLCSTEEKLEIFDRLGVESVMLADFSAIADLSPEAFVKGSLVADMNCRAAVAGYDFRFGRGASGDVAELTRLLADEGAECITEPEMRLDGEKISSTAIKELLLHGDVARANKFLGMPYCITCRAAHGLGLGRKLGFPTVNCDFTDFTPPLRRGVYRCAAEVGGRLYHAVTNVGVCPTFCERGLHAETYIADFSGDLYGEKIRIFFLGYLRDERRFESANELIMQINIDKNRTIKENGELKWQEIGLS